MVLWLEILDTLDLYHQRCNVLCASLQGTY